MKKIFLISAAIFLFGTFFVFPVRAESIVSDGVTHVETYNVDMNVNADATVAVTEKINYAYGDQANLGWTRYIPLNYVDLSDSNIAVNASDVTVTDENNNPYIFTQSNF